MIAAETAGRRGEDDHAQELALTAVGRGIPLFSEGLSILGNLVPRLLVDDDLAADARERLRLAAEPVLSLSPMAEFGALASTLRIDPDPGAVTSETGWRQFVRASMPTNPGGLGGCPPGNEHRSARLLARAVTGEVFRLHVLPAGVGDALVLDYGTEADVHRVVIDGGVGRIAQPLADFLGPTPQVEMMMISHIDNDHIAGLLKMLETGLTQADDRRLLVQRLPAPARVRPGADGAGRGRAADHVHP